MFLKGFNEEERVKLGMVMGLCLANGLGNPSCLVALFDDHLVKEGTSTVRIKQIQIFEMDFLVEV